MIYCVKRLDDTILGYTDAPRFIRLSEDGVFIEADMEEAQGIAFDGAAYNLQFAEPMREDLDGAFVEEMETVELVMDQMMWSQSNMMDDNQADLILNQAEILAAQEAVDETLADILLNQAAAAAQ